MIIRRSSHNPILTPNTKIFWEAHSVFNGCPVKKEDNIFLVYRAISLPHYSVLANQTLQFSSIGIAQSKNGVSFTNRHRFIIPEMHWEKFGCEDPRITKLNNKYYTFYTALSEYPFKASGIKVGLAISKDLKSIQEKHLITPFNAKGMALFPEKINGKFWTILTVNTDNPPSRICLASFENEKQMWSEKYWNKWYKGFESFALNLKRKPEDHVEVGAPPIKTKEGWLLFYSYIRNYYTSNKLFSIEAVLLDINNPLKIIARTKNPLLTPDEYYERIGAVDNIVFPSGALKKDNKTIYLYYGAADNTCCLAKIDTKLLLNYMTTRDTELIMFERAQKEPIISPIKKHSWESKSTFNPGAIYLDGKVHIVYRALSESNTSMFGYATSIDGINIDYRSPEPIYVPRESFEQKIKPEIYSGCEDPRLTKINDKIYMLYTAFDSLNPPRVALTWIKEKDFLNKKWDWAKPVLISPPNLDDKDACIFPEKINGKYCIIHRSGDDMDLDFRSSLDFSNDMWLDEMRWIAPRKGHWDSKKVGLASPPIKIKQGWLLFYHGVSEDNIYRVGAILLDSKNPFRINCRTNNFIFEPETNWEKNGLVPNVVFPCGTVMIKDKIYMYYGGADSVVGVATIKLKDLLKKLNVSS